ncbi:MAG: riboflavin synthase [Pseudomonadota bacterium]|nr:riboflavin synthase [Pseudomonadota bacterium]MED5274725.1 riboflavin synthase [Pseudomonadota bacterium]
MFSGIIENIGMVENCLSVNGNQKILIKIDNLSNKIKDGDSISINGVCLTVEEINSNIYSFSVSPETLNLTTLNHLKKNSYVNIETPLTMEKFLSGHLTAGHIDNTGTIHEISKENNSWNLFIKVNKGILKYSATKGSIAIDGVSLTINQIKSDILCIMLIPHTYENTIAQYYKEGDLVNIEIDLLFRYIEKIKNG